MLSTSKHTLNVLANAFRPVFAYFLAQQLNIFEKLHLSFDPLQTSATKQHFFKNVEKNYDSFVQ